MFVVRRNVWGQCSHETFAELCHAVYKLDVGSAALKYLAPSITNCRAE
jgi:hypothetical protein